MKPVTHNTHDPRSKKLDHISRERVQREQESDLSLSIENIWNANKRI